MSDNLRFNWKVTFKFKMPRYEKEIERINLHYKGLLISSMIPSNVKSIVIKEKFKDKLKIVHNFLKTSSLKRGNIDIQ